MRLENPPPDDHNFQKKAFLCSCGKKYSASYNSIFTLQRDENYCYDIKS